MADPKVLRTRVYVDGFNLYYGCLKRTEFKWLDLRALVEQILETINHDVDGSAALCHHLGKSIVMIEGSYDAKPARAHRYQKGKIASECVVGAPRIQ